ncbi:MAG: manganese efflux pump [Lentisphaeria bacterium]|nr:manganese efflux pump [Lentisphaeria bacterium]
MGVGLAMDALAVSLALGAVGWSCPKTQPDVPGAPPEAPAERPWFRRLPFLGPTPAAPVCAVCHARGPDACGCGRNPGRGTLTWDKIVLTAMSFGVFQAVMPTVGWFASGLCGGFVQKLGRIAAGLLLAFVAAQMFREGFSKAEDPSKRIGVCSLRRLVVLSFATSIDALLVGVSYACLGRTDITGDVLLIGAVTAAISAAGCVSGRVFGNRLGSRSSIFGGAVLLAIAVKIIFYG